MTGQDFMPEGHPALLFDVAALAASFGHYAADDIPDGQSEGERAARDGVMSLLERIGTVDSRTLATVMAEVLRASADAYLEQEKAVAQGVGKKNPTPENMFITQLAAICPVDCWEWLADLTAHQRVHIQDLLRELPIETIDLTDELPELLKCKGLFPPNNQNGHN